MRRVAVIVERDDDKVLRAVAGGDHRHVEELIEEGADFNVQTPNGHTVLHVAAARGRANVLRVLLVVPAIVDIKDTQDDEGRTALWIAAANGELESLRLLLDCCASPTIAAHSGETALHVALAGAWGRVAESLLEVEPSLLNAQTNAGRTPLHYVVAASAYFPAALECLEALAENHDLDYGVQDEEGKTALSWACEMGADLAVELLVNKAPEMVFVVDKRKRTPVHWAMLGEAPIMCLKTILRATKDDTPVDAADETGLTPLHLAALNSHALVAKLLISAAAKTNVADNKGRTLAHAAATGNSPEMWALLGEQEGFDFDARDKDGRSALTYAAIMGRPHGIIALLAPKLAVDVNNEDSEKCTPLFWATYAGNTKGVQRLLAAGANAKICDSLKRTPLHVAAIFGHAEVLSALVSKGNVDPSAPDRVGNTPLHLLAARGHSELITWLIVTCGKDLLHARNAGGRTPLHLAVAFSSLECVRTLLELGSDITAVDKKNRTCLHFAVSAQGTDPVRMLELLLTADPPPPINAPDIAGRTALHLAAALGLYTCVNFLLSQKATPDVADSAGSTPLHLAAYSSDAETAEQLLQGGADCLKRDKKGRTPLHLAVLQTTPTGDGVLTLLLQRKDVLEATDNVGRTAIHYAALSDMPRLIDLAASQRSDAFISLLTRADRRGLTALHLAATRGSLAVFQTLLDLLPAEAVALRDEKGRTVVHVLLLALPRTDAGALYDCLQLLRARPAEPLSILDNAGRSPLDYLTALCVNSPALFTRLKPLLLPK